MDEHDMNNGAGPSSSSVPPLPHASGSGTGVYGGESGPRYQSSTDSGSTTPMQTSEPRHSASPVKKEKKPHTFLTALIAVIIGLVVGGGIVGVVAAGILSSGGGTVSVSPGTSATPITINPASEDTTLASAVAAKTTPAVVSIDVYTQSSSLYGGIGYGGSDSAGSSETYSGLGSGVIITTDGYILTNYHVIEGSSSLVVHLEDGNYDAKVIGADEQSDLAVIKIDATGLTKMDVADSDAVVVGEWVMSIGSPYGEEDSVSTGIVSALYRSSAMQGSTGYTIYANMIQTDAAINPGNSGGALVDDTGSLIGINTLIDSSSGSGSGVGFAIPSNYAMDVANQIMEGKTVEHAYLGVSLGTVTPQNASSENLSVTSGAYVGNVASGTPAAEAGLQEGDVITKFDDETIDTASALIIAVRSHSVGDSATITYMRGSETKTAQVTLASDVNTSSSDMSGGGTQQGR